MNINSKGTLLPASADRSRRRGIALPAALFGLVTVSVMSVGVFSMTDLQAKSVKNRVSSAQAAMLAEAGMVHALTVLRDSLKNKEPADLFMGYDNQFGTADDNLLVGYGLSERAQIPAAGRNLAEGNYKVIIADDPGDGDSSMETDTNKRFMINCTGETADGAKVTLSAVIGNAAFPGVVTEGDLTINGTPEIVGKCGGAHANAVAIVSGNPVVTNTISATSSVRVNGSIENPSGDDVVPLQYQPPLEIPVVLPLDYCGSADYTLYENGTMKKKGDPTTYSIAGSAKWGWKRTKGPSDSYVEFEHDAATATPGTVCAYGSLKVSGNPGSAANPLAMSLIATGSIQISGNPYLKPSSPDGIMFLSGADVEINGNPDAGALNYEGLIYATSQCKIGGNPEIHGQIVCKNEPNPTKTWNVAEGNTIGGNPKITYNCGGFKITRRRILSWYQTGS
jgi:hypothetical protein